MDAIIFIVRTLLQVLLVTVFLLRVLLPLSRADSRNQLSSPATKKLAATGRIAPKPRPLPAQRGCMPSSPEKRPIRMPTS